MPLFRNAAGQGVYLFAHDSSGAKPGDAANITGSYALDGTDHSGFATANPTEMGGGVYWQPLAQAETDANRLAYRWGSSTGGVVVDPVFEATGVQLAEVAHGGEAATLRLGSSGTPAFFVTNSAGNAVRFEATALDGGGLALIGGPDGGNGLYCLGGSNSGDAAILRGQGGNSAGLILQGSGSSAGLDSLGGSGAPGGHFTGGSGSPGLVCEAAGGDADGVKFLGSGSGTGLFCQGGSDGGNGVHFVAGGADLAGVGQGAGAYAEGGGSSGCGIICLAYDGTSEAALSLRGSASGEGPGLSITANSGGVPGLIVIGGPTGHAVALVGGSTSGDGLNITTTSGNAITLSPTGGYGLDGTLSPAMLAQFVTADTTKTADDIAAGSVVYLSQHSIAGLGF
jgi:hypothetical protein